ncbi:MAG: Hsp20/alpha crystallin family protein [Gammaproteobacteria bacterium]|nr:Hsp20/alpha crystallin family protein [Gammaproteobacteria bacterium]NNC97510.1 Hsp20/alpha crystallin family protein [Gammaproteobacteria bacterium]NNM14226.1 Hsp20/alpha crystallin family protein [Gammaproteobacteria bacterium]
MQLSKFKPWNWFKNEQEQEKAINPVLARNELSPIMQLHSEIDRMINQVFHDFSMPLATDTGGLLSGASGLFKPSVDIHTKANKYQLLVEIPGVDEDAIELELVNDTLAIKGEKEHSHSQEEADNFIVERTYGSFQRLISLPDDVDKNNIQASFKNGVLNIVLPRVKQSEAHKGKIIDIKTAA